MIVDSLCVCRYAADSVSESDKESRDEPHDEDTAPQVTLTLPAWYTITLCVVYRLPSLMVIQ